MKAKGVVPIKMTDYGIKPPTAIFGRLKTGDEVKVNFELTVGAKAIATALGGAAVTACRRSEALGESLTHRREFPVAFLLHLPDRAASPSCRTLPSALTSEFETDHVRYIRARPSREEHQPPPLPSRRRRRRARRRRGDRLQAGRAGEGRGAAASRRPGQTGGTMGAHDTVGRAPPLPRAEAMDAMHEKGIKAFPGEDRRARATSCSTPRMDNGVKVFELTAKKIQWEIEPGRMVEAWAYNDQVPGPQIRVREGDRVRVILHNKLPESTAIHFHGLELPNDMDGVPFITQPPVKPGQSFTYEFTVPNAGSHMYHSHHNSAKQVGLGLLGAFIVEPKDKTPYDHGRRRLRVHPQRRRARLHVQRQELSRDAAARREAGPEGAHPLHERRDDDPPDAPARHAHDGHRQGRLAHAGAVEVRHAQRRAGRALGRDRQLQQPRHLGVPLPHPAARRVASTACSGW